MTSGKALPGQQGTVGVRRTERPRNRTPHAPGARHGNVGRPPDRLGSRLDREHSARPPSRPHKQTVHRQRELLRECLQVGPGHPNPVGRQHHDGCIGVQANHGQSAEPSKERASVGVQSKLPTPTRMPSDPRSVICSPNAAPAPGCLQPAGVGSQSSPVPSASVSFAGSGEPSGVSAISIEVMCAPVLSRKRV